MRLHNRIAGAALLALATLSCSELGIGGKPKPKDTGKSLAQDDRMAWWREARFGMFIHWGLYAIPAGTWNGETNHAEWIRDTAKIPVGEYEKFQKQFNPVDFDADQWVRFAKAAGMQYIVVTSKHHDGFCMWDSELTKWDVMGTPFKRDVLKEISEACKREKIRFCTYHSIMDWHHPDYLPRRTWEDRPVDGADYARYEEYLHGQVTEIVERYHPSVMWFDGEWENTWNHERGVQLFELCRTLDPKMIVNNRVDVHRAGMGGFNTSSEAVGDFSTPEQEIPATGMPGVDWETCLTMNDHWGYNSHDKNWKTSQELIRLLVDVASKGGNLLLNIGPKADGTFPSESIERLEAISTWMEKNGKAIHGTTASPFDSLPWGRCTVRVGKKKTKLYLEVFDWPADTVLALSGLGNPVKRAYLMTKPDKELEVKKRDGRVQIQVPKSAPDATCSVVVLEISGVPMVYRTPRIVAAVDEFVSPLRVVLDAGSQGLALHYTTDGREPTRFSTLYKDPLEISESCTLQVRTFHDDNPVSDVASRSFRKAVPLPAQAGAGSEPGLTVEHFALGVDALPADWSTLAPDRTATATEIELPSGTREENVVMRWRGFVEVPADDMYLFALASDDGSRLVIDGRTAVDNDGLHTTTEKQGALALAKGRHAIDVQWFNRSGGAELALRFAELGGDLRAIPAGALTH